MPHIHQEQIENQAAIIVYSSEFRWHDNVDRNSSQNLEYPAEEPAITMAILDEAYSQESRSIHTDNYEVNYLDSNSHGGNGLGRVVRLSLPQVEPWSAPTFHALQEWEGYVIKIDEKNFVARLVDLTVGLGPEEEEAEIPMSVLSDEDKVKLRLGSIFRWVIGYERHVTGKRRTGSEIVLREVPLITEKDLRDGETWARKVISSFNL